MITTLFGYCADLAEFWIATFSSYESKHDQNITSSCVDKKSLPGTYTIFFADSYIHEVDKNKSKIGITITPSKNKIDGLEYIPS